MQPYAATTLFHRSMKNGAYEMEMMSSPSVMGKASDPVETPLLGECPRSSAAATSGEASGSVRRRRQP